jgi:ketosteroid isomerase-like protein
LMPRGRALRNNCGIRVLDSMVYYRQGLRYALAAALLRASEVLMSRNVDAVRRLFAAVEQRDLETILDCYDEKVEINESGLLPYGGVYRGHDGVRRHAAAFIESWSSYQTPDECRLDAKFFEADDGAVAAVFRHRAVDPQRGARLDAPEVGIYEVRDDKIVRTQMFHYDPVALQRFLDACERS